VWFAGFLTGFCYQISSQCIWLFFSLIIVFCKPLWLWEHDLNGPILQGEFLYNVSFLENPQVQCE